MKLIFFLLYSVFIKDLLLLSHPKKIYKSSKILNSKESTLNKNPLSRNFSKNVPLLFRNIKKSKPRQLKLNLGKIS